MSYLSVENVSKIYGTDVKVEALSDVSFHLENGQFVVILGSSGAGKTTLLNVLGGMDTVSGGKVTLDGKDVTALENVELAVEICPDHLEPQEVLAEVGLKDRLNNFPAQLSGGEQQRVSIARAVAKNAKLLLCDEPTGALDYVTGKKILGILHDVCKKRNKLVIIVTHNSALKDMADKVIHIKNGQIEYTEDNANPKDIEEIEW